MEPTLTLTPGTCLERAVPGTGLAQWETLVIDSGPDEHGMVTVRDSWNRQYKLHELYLAPDLIREEQP